MSPSSLVNPSSFIQFNSFETENNTASRREVRVSHLSTERKVEKTPGSLRTSKLGIAELEQMKEDLIADIEVLQSLGKKSPPLQETPEIDQKKVSAFDEFRISQKEKLN
jgi:hypothetical protein